MNLVLQITKGKSAGYRRSITNPERILIGRDSSCNLSLPDPLLSRRHCIITITPNETQIVDMGSRNGTYVNGQKLPVKTSQLLNPHDEVKIGSHVIQVLPATQAAGSAPQQPTPMPQGLNNQGHVVTTAKSSQKMTQAVERMRRTMDDMSVGSVDQIQSLDNQRAHVPTRSSHVPSNKQGVVHTTRTNVPARNPQNNTRVHTTASKGQQASQAAAPPQQNQDKGEHPSKIGQYEILDVLGMGGMGVVYKAQHSFLETIVAIKVIKEELAMHGDIVKRFLQEAKLGVSLDHPYILRIHDAGEYEGIYFISMEFFNGSDLNSIVKENGNLSTEMLLKYAIQMSDALGYAHKRGVIHRDVKPPNILVQADGQETKLADFGLAKAWQNAGAHHLTASGQTLGTIQYISPEQLEDSRNVDPQTDIFSLGASFYFAAAGKPPFGEEPLGTVIRNILHNDPPPIEGMPEPLEKCLHRAMAKKRKDRYQTMEEFNQDLKKVAQEILG